MGQLSTCVRTALRTNTALEFAEKIKKEKFIIGGFTQMRKLSVVITFFLAVGCASAQSLKPENPYPLRAGINKGTADSFVGTHYWYFYATPGSTKVTVRFTQAATVFGTQISNNTLTITLTDEKKTWRSIKVITPNRNQSEATFTSAKLKNKIKVIVSVAPPNQTLVRMGGDYEIEATGDVQFDEVKNAADPIIGTFESKVEYYGATKFLAGGTVETSEGSRGTWKAFDSKNHIYTVVIGNRRYSVQYLPGYGLVKPDDPNIIVFQELRR
jgi:hypothetical protein